MYKTCKTEQSAARQKAIALALLDELSGRPYSEVTITDLCRTLGMPRKTFYRYFDTKEDVLAALVDSCLLECSLSVDPERRTRQDNLAVLHRFFDYWLQHKRLLDALQRNGLSGLLVERGAHLAMSQNLPIIPQRHLGKDQQLHQVVLFAHAGLTALILQWHHEGCRRSTLHMAQDALTLLTCPLFAYE